MPWLRYRRRAQGSGAAKVDQGSGFSGGASVKLEANGARHCIQFVANIPASGRYEIHLQYKSFPSRGTLSLSVDGADQGPPVDMYASSGRYDGVVSLGTKGLPSGAKPVSLSHRGQEHRQHFVRRPFRQTPADGEPRS